MVFDPEQNVVPDSRCDESEYEHALLSGAASPRPIPGRRAAWAGGIAAAALAGVMVVAIVAKPSVDNGRVGDPGWEGSLARLIETNRCTCEHGEPAVGCTDGSHSCGSCQLGFHLSGRAQYCLKITTGTASRNNGDLKVHLDAGEGSQKVAHGHFSKGDVVVHRCFSNPITWVDVQNEKKDGWTGSIYYSIDAGETFEAMVCSHGCNTAGSASSISVDGDDWTTTERRSGMHCIYGQTCRLTQDPTFKGSVTLRSVCLPGALPAPEKSDEEFDCTVGRENREAGWSDEKKEFCKFDCAAGLDNWEKGWSDEKKRLCCQPGRGECKNKKFDCIEGLESWAERWAERWPDVKKKFCCHAEWCQEVFRIETSKHGGDICVQAPPETAANKDALLEQCTTDKRQEWRKTEEGDITHIHNGKGLCIAAPAWIEGGQVIVEECDNSASQNLHYLEDGKKLQFVSQDGKKFCISSAHEGKATLQECVDGNEDHLWALEWVYED